MNRFAWIALLALVFASCTKGTNERYLILKFKFDPTQERLNDTGGIATIPQGNAAQSPAFNYISAHYAELSPSATTPLGSGTILYKAPEFMSSSDTGIDFSKSVVVKEGEAFLSIPLTSIKPGTYEWLRLSLAYQNYDVTYKLDTVINSFVLNGVQYPGSIFSGNYIGTIASFIGFKTYFDNGYTIKSQKVSLSNQFRKQGYWGFETSLGTNSIYYPAVTKTGQAPTGATTVVNPLFATSPIPQGSCVVTAAINGVKYSKDGFVDPLIMIKPLVITGAETESIILECSLSTNNSFEWRDNNGNNMWDPLKGEQVINMGIRGMKPVVLNK